MDPLVRTQPRSARPSGQVRVRAIPLTVQNETPLEEPRTVGSSSNPSKKNCKKSPWRPVLCVFLALLLLAAGVAGGVYLDRTVLQDKRDEELSKLNPSVEGTDEVAQVLTAEEEADLSSKISYYTLTAWDTQPAEDVSVKTDLNPEVFTRFMTNSLTDEDKISIAINSLSNEYQPTDIENDAAKTYSLSVERVSERYMSLFGTEIPDLNEGIAFCPGFSRDEAAGVYYIGTGCGGTNPSWNLLYKESFSIDNGVANAFIRVGSKVFDEPTGQSAIYDDYLDSTTKALYRTEEELGGPDAVTSFKIDGADSQNFAQYRVTFSKNANGEFSLDFVVRM